VTSTAGHRDGDVVIAGGGIGGLAAALALHQRGVGCRVLEASRELRPLGVGINLLPSAVRVLTGLGLLDRLREGAVETGELLYVNRFGQRIWREPRGRGAGYDYPQVSCHRGRLQLLLLAAVRERLGRDAVETGCAATGFVQHTDRVEVAIEDRAAGTTATIAAAALVGADGIHSAVRRQVATADDAVRYAGRMLWRATTLAPGFLTGASMIMAGHQDQKFVCYPITPPDASGRQVLNWVAELPVAEQPAPQDWSREVDRARFRDAFAAWRFDWLDVPALIDGAERVYEYPLADRDPLATWGGGRVTLLGDAAHPMYPIGSNGASQAILDAEALAAAFAADPGTALARYEQARREPTARIVLANRGNGPEQVMQLAHERAPDGFGDIEDVIPRAELEEIAARYKRLAGFAPEQVNR
jgi:2-polyprenyl-6-methoxyphenol hydroxylase-like FAD-dependent oxidoreductase